MRNKIILLMLLGFVTAFSYQESYEVLAHFEDIDVMYDDCQYEHYIDENNIGDGINERWYHIIPNILNEDTYTHHITTSNGTTKEIKYCSIISHGVY